MFGWFKREKKEDSNKVHKVFYCIMSKHSDKLLDAEGGEANSNAIIWKENDGENQQWTIKEVGGGWHRIKNKSTKQYLTVAGHNEGAKLCIRNGVQGDKNQLFKLY